MLATADPEESEPPPKARLGSPKFPYDRFLDDPFIFQAGEDDLRPVGSEAPGAYAGEKFPPVGIGIQGRLGHLVEELQKQRLLGPLRGARGIAGNGRRVSSDLDARGRRRSVAGP